MLILLKTFFQEVKQLICPLKFFCFGNKLFTIASPVAVVNKWWSIGAIQITRDTFWPILDLPMCHLVTLAWTLPRPPV